VISRQCGIITGIAIGKLVSYGVIVAWILKSCTKEFLQYIVQFIMDNYLRKKPEISKQAVYRDQPDKEDVLDDYWSSEMKNIRYYRYQSGKMTYMQNLATLLKSDFESNYYSLHGMSDEEGKFLELDGKGHLSADLCLQFSDFDYKHCTRTLTLKDGKFSVNTSSSLTCLEPEYNDYKVQKSMKIYATAGGKTVAATLKKGKKVYVTGIYKNSKGKLYFKVKYEGKTGYTDPSILMKNAEMLGCLHA
jgi:hypothetical protein